MELKLHPKAVQEINELFDYISQKAGRSIASAYIDRLYQFLDNLKTFPKRGSVREGETRGLRIVGFERRASIAFQVEADVITVLGVFAAGRNVTVDALRDRR